MKARWILSSALLAALVLALAAGAGSLRAGAATFAQEMGSQIGGQGTYYDADGAQGSADGGQIEDYVVQDDLIVTGSECLGYDCATDGTESFGFDTIKLKENNLQIYFDDTSTTQGFPDNDWRIITNDSTSGGAEYIKIQDSTNSKEPFKIMAGARTNSIFVSDAGRVGLGTSTPGSDLHILDADTPAVRLERPATQIDPAWSWDVGVNWLGFFARDTVSDTYPLVLKHGAPTYSLVLDEQGDLYLGNAPHGAGFDLSVLSAGEDTEIVAFGGTGGAAVAVLAGTATDARIGSLSDHPLTFVTKGVPSAVLDTAGNLTIEGALTEASDVNRKQDFCAVDQASVLSRIASLSVFTWSYKGESVRHMGPTAQDFYGAFGLGTDDKHIAPLDANGVALAGIQELYRQLQAEQAETARLSAENEELRQRLDTLEALVEQLLAAQAEK